MIFAGLQCIKKGQANFSWSQDEDGNNGSERIVTGFPAILIGIFEIGVGVYALVYQKFPVL